MKFTTSIFLTTPLLLACASAAALPDPSSKATGLPGGLYICDQENWKGTCKWFMPTTDCIASRDIFGGKAKSIGPDVGGYCHLWVGSKCTGHYVQDLDQWTSQSMVKYPGWPKDVPKFGSIKCSTPEKGQA